MIDELTFHFRIKHQKTTPYNLKANGLTKKSNGLLCKILLKVTVSHAYDWDTKLLAALWAYRTAEKVTTKQTPYYLTYSQHPILPTEFELLTHRILDRRRLGDEESQLYRLQEVLALEEQREAAKQRTEQIQLKRKKAYDKRVRPVSYEELRPFRRKLSELRLDFLLWNWNCVSASICSDVDLLFEKSSVGLTHIEEFSYGPLFSSERQGTNGWKTADYIDPKRKAFALGIMHILRQARTTKGIEDDTRQPSIPPQTTARGPVQVDVVQRRKKPKRRLAKRRKVVSDDEGDLALEVRRTETEVDVIRQSRTRARPKKRANRELMAAKVSDSSVKKIVAPIVSIAEVVVGESIQPVEMEGPSGVLIEVLADAPA
ncbi:hypothetical protein AXG93_4530s1000 [Marchantia polymorpha subsp. ruderalis]|uniref:Integrase catalytic domain-containing protein n=1 Tax=Marchantia polymorpha subsp. ruderalis TaxID=1480154 RepID=A0A176VUB9_MARPO|nr:hypothetical protein AXG93_4530s1000 [Marchantia polymorpha subsp. ruderalis]